MRGHEHDVRCIRQRLDHLGRFESAEPGQVDVEKDDVVRSLRQFAQRIDGVAGLGDVDVFGDFAQRVDEFAADQRLVVDYERAHAAGRVARRAAQLTGPPSGREPGRGT